MKPSRIEYNGPPAPAGVRLIAAGLVWISLIVAAVMVALTVVASG